MGPSDMEYDRPSVWPSIRTAVRPTLLPLARSTVCSIVEASNRCIIGLCAACGREVWGDSGS